MMKLSKWNKARLNGSIKSAIQRKEKDWKLRMAEKELEALLEEEEIYWKFRSREDWLRWGDKNTK